MPIKSVKLGAIAPYAFYGGAEKQFGYFTQANTYSKDLKVMFLSLSAENGSLRTGEFKDRYGDIAYNHANTPPTLSSNTRSIFVFLFGYFLSCMKTIWYLRDRDVVYAYSLYTLPPLLVLKLLGKKTIYSERLFSIDLEKRSKIYKLLKYFDAIVVNSNELKDWASALNSNVFLVQNVVEEILWEKNGPQSNSIAIVARVHPEKNIDFVIAATPPHLTVNVYGQIQDRSYHHHLIESARKKGLRINFINHCSINDIYNSNDLIVLPSKYEGTSNVILEAICSNKPIIVSRIKANTDLKLHSECYFSIDEQDTSELSILLHHYYENGFSKEALIRNNKAAEPFSRKRFDLNISRVVDAVS